MQRVLALMKRALLIGIAAALLGAIGTTAKAEDAAGKLKIETDGRANKESQLKIFKDQSDLALPHIIEVLVPSSAGINRAGQGAELNGPNAGAVLTIIYALMDASQAKGDAGKAIWRLAIGLTVLGIALTGFLTFKKVTAGKMGPGEALSSWLGKTILSMLLISVVASHMPYMLVKICDDITGGTNPPAQLEQGQKDTVDAMIASVGAQFDAVLYDNVVSAAGVIAKAAENPDSGITLKTKEEIIPALWNGVISTTQSMKDNSGQMNAAIGGRFSFSRLKQTLFDPNNGTYGVSIEDINNAIVKSASEAYVKARQDIAKNARRILQLPEDGSKPAANAKGEANWEALGKAMAPRPINGAAIARPSGVIKMAAYITLVYVAIGIWCLPLAILFWAALSAFPTDWFSGLLFSGMKVVLGIILTVFLAATFISAGINQTIAKASQLERLGTGVMDLGKSIVGAGGNAGGNIMNFALWWSNTTMEEMAITVLILGSPLMAAGIMKGSNGIAETAKKAMLAGGAYGGVQTLTGNFGSYGTMAGAPPSRSEIAANQGSRPG